MTTPSSTVVRNTQRALSELTEELRDGPLQQLIELKLEADALAERLADESVDKVAELERLVRLSLLAMQRFHTFTREAAALLREVMDEGRPRH